MTTSDRNETHDEIVARRIVERLVAAGLLPPAYADKMAKRLGEGKVKAEDWRLLAERALEQDSMEGRSGQEAAR